MQKRGSVIIATLFECRIEELKLGIGIIHIIWRNDMYRRGGDVLKFMFNSRRISH
jgi:hypothetical protein